MSEPIDAETQSDMAKCVTCADDRPCGIHDPVLVPHALRWVVAKLLMMHDAGWEVCGFQGGGSGKVQFQKVEFRRRPPDAHD